MNIITRNNHASFPHTQASQRTIVIIDPGVADYQMLANGVVEGADVFILDPHRDGVHQITDYLTQSKIQNPKS
jgi:hypothetical protein